MEKDAEPFFKLVKDYVFGRPTTLENIVRSVDCGSMSAILAHRSLLFAVECTYF